LDVQQIADERHAISAFGVSLPPSASEATPEVVQPAGISSQSRVRFRSARFGIGACLLPGSLLFYFCQLIPCVSLLVFLLVSATINDENYFKFKWL
jgi:hypothetical protein